MPAVSPAAGVTLEITCAPTDLPHAEHILPHQLRRWAGQVDDIQFTFDLHQSRGRFGAAAQERLPGMRRLLAELCDEHPHAHVEEVDYSPETVAAVARQFFGAASMPPKNHYGGPLYSYFYGPHVARHDHILHVDSDMLFGGGSQTWTREAVASMEERSDLVLCSPWPGPPTADGTIPPEVLARHTGVGSEPTAEPGDGLAAWFSGFTTRLYLMHRPRFLERLGPLPLERPRARSRARGFLEGHPPWEVPETTITRQMHRRQIRRLDFLGTEPGMWSLHPALRSELFYAELPGLVERVEAGDLPAAQLGDFDVNDSMIDWTSAREAVRRQTWWRRMPRTVSSRLRG